MDDWPVSPWGMVRFALKRLRVQLKRLVFGLHGSVTFNDREGLRLARPAKVYFAKPKYTTYALWWTGQGVIKHEMRQLGCNIETLVLPDPRETELIASLETTWADWRFGSVEAIRRTTKNALALNVDVYWYPGWPGAALTFQNPESNKGTLAIEKISANRPPGRRPINYYRRKNNRDLYDSEWERFQELVDTAEHMPLEKVRRLEREGVSPGIELPPIDYHKEDKRDEWPIYQVAFLWHGYEPPVIKRHWDEMNRDIQDRKNMLHAAVDRDELSPSREKRYPNGVTRYVSREELRRFCEARDERPPFLFPEER